jgi:hypothetical protein
MLCPASSAALVNEANAALSRADCAFSALLVALLAAGASLIPNPLLSVRGDQRTHAYQCRMAMEPMQVLIASRQLTKRSVQLLHHAYRGTQISVSCRIQARMPFSAPL